MAKGVFRGLLDLIFPPRCVFCRGFLKRGERGVCADCLEHLPYTGRGVLQNGTAFKCCAAPLYYEGLVRKSFHRFKFSGATGYASPYGALMADTVKRYLRGKYDLITWIPVSAKRKKDRGYDQSMLLAMAMSLALDDVAVETLSKHRHTQAQSELGGLSERSENIRGAFQVTDPEFLKDKRILLVDDILTTGSTLSECASILAEAGAKEVYGIVLARTRREKN